MGILLEGFWYSVKFSFIVYICFFKNLFCSISITMKFEVKLRLLQ